MMAGGVQRRQKCHNENSRTPIVACFYATQIGPLPRDEANQLCESLKGAGGNCFIQRN
jgi:cell division septation protein DedD